MIEADVDPAGAPETPHEAAKRSEPTPSAAEGPAERVRRLTGAAARSAAGEKVGGRPPGIKEERPRKRRSNLAPLQRAPGTKEPRGLRPLTRPQAVFASLWVSGQYSAAEALEKALETCGLEIPSGLQQKAERWLRAPQVRVEAERIAQLSGVPSSILAAAARRKLWEILHDNTDRHVQHQAVMTALKLNGDLRASGSGAGLVAGRGEEGSPAIGTVVLAQINAGAAVGIEVLQAALTSALQRSGEANRSAHHRHAEGALLPEPTP